MFADGAIVQVPCLSRTVTGMTGHHAVPFPCTGEFYTEQNTDRKAQKLIYTMLLIWHMCFNKNCYQWKNQ